MRLRKEDRRPDWTVQPEDVVPDWTLGEGFPPMVHDDEARRGVMMPVQVYPLFESALRAAAGRTQEEHLVHVSELWAGFSAVASTNPDAWIQRAYTAEEIRTFGPDNRLVGWPYPKLMNSNSAVEQGAAVILCSAERAEALGVPRDRWVFPWAGADAHDTPFVSNRPTLAGSPAIRDAGRHHVPPRRGRRRRPRPRRPLLLLPVRGAGGGGRARARHRPAPDRDRRAELRRRAVEQLRGPLARHDAARPAGGRRLDRARDRERRVPHQARARPLLHRATPHAARSAGSRRRRRPMRPARSS